MEMQDEGSQQDDKEKQQEPDFHKSSQQTGRVFAEESQNAKDRGLHTSTVWKTTGSPICQRKPAGLHVTDRKVKGGELGMLTLQLLSDQISAGEMDTVIVGTTDVFGKMMGRRYDASFFLESASGGPRMHACSNLWASNFELHLVAGCKITNWETGFGDYLWEPDLRTLRTCSWLDRTAHVTGDILLDSCELAPHIPRSILKQQLTILSASGYQCKAATEMEYYLYQDSFEDANKKGYTGLVPFERQRQNCNILQGTREEFFNGSARRHLAASGVPVEYSRNEGGLGQNELVIRYADALEIADRHVIYKQCLKEVAESQGVSITFMAKPSSSQSGSSCHIHLSLWKGDQNAFVGDQQLGPIEYCSDEFRWFLGGWMRYAPELMLFYAPIVNSYKRFRDSSAAPTRIAWSKDNRSAAFRVVGSGKSLRIECRLPGADCNAYLGLAASVASGLEGIKLRIEPPKHSSGDVYEGGDFPRLPRSLQDAVEAFEKGAFVAKMLTKEVQAHFALLYRSELEAYEAVVTDWERMRYFELI